MTPTFCLPLPYIIFIFIFIFKGRMERAGEGRKGRGPQGLIHTRMFEILKNTLDCLIYESNILAIPFLIFTGVKKVRNLA